MAEIFDGVDGILVPGGFGDRGIEGKINADRTCAGKTRYPFSGSAWACSSPWSRSGRHLAGCKGAHSTEFNEETPCPVIYLIEEWIDRENQVQKRDKYRPIRAARCGSGHIRAS